MNKIKCDKEKENKIDEKSFCSTKCFETAYRKLENCGLDLFDLLDDLHTSINQGKCPLCHNGL